MQNQGEHRQAIVIAQAVIKTMIPAISRSDDSDGFLGGQIEMAIEVLEHSAKQLPTKEQQSLLSYLIKEVLSGHLEGGG